jgi:uncharacterized protein (UPF0305 family)
MDSRQIAGECAKLRLKKARGELGAAIAKIILSYSPRDLQQMRWNFSSSIQDISPEYRKRLEETITGHLHGTYQNLRLMDQQGAFSSMGWAVSGHDREFWSMVAGQCSGGDEGEVRLRFLKFLLAGFCMFVQQQPGHPVGMLFPGGDKVELIDGIYYCLVREKANDVDSALCPFCPRTPDPGDRVPQAPAQCNRAPETGVYPALSHLSSLQRVISFPQIAFTGIPVGTALLFVLHVNSLKIKKNPVRKYHVLRALRRKNSRGLAVLRTVRAAC